MKKDKKRRDDDEKPAKKKPSKMDELKAQWDEDDEKGEGDENILKLEEGKTTLRVLPRLDPEEPFFEMWGMHYNMGPDGTASFRCIEPEGPFGHSKKKDKQRNYRARVCPACKKYCKNKSRARSIAFGSPEGKKFWGDHVAPYRAKQSFVFAVSKPKSKEPTKIYVLRCGVMIAKPLIEARYDSDVGDITSPKRGRNIKVTMTKLSAKDSTNIEYTVGILDRSKLEEWPEMKAELPDLTTFTPEALDADAIVEIMNGEGDDSDDDDAPRRKKSKNGKSRDDDDTDDEDLDDDDDDAAERRLKTKKRPRGEEEDVDPDAEEEDDDEKPSKKKGKKSKMRSKLSKKAQRDDDEDAEDDDEDEDEEEDDDAEGDEDDDNESEDEDEDLDDEDED
jgi:hypothetical protein